LNSLHLATICTGKRHILEGANMINFFYLRTHRFPNFVLSAWVGTSAT